MNKLNLFYKGRPAPQYSPVEGVGARDGNYIYGSSGWYRAPNRITLPNGGGSYGYPSMSSGARDEGTTPAPVADESPVVDQELPKPDVKPPRSKYINPKTGEYFAPQEYANYVASKIPTSKETGDIPQYAGDAMTKPDESAEDLTKRARNISNTRNDIATGTTDPYKIGAESGIAYSPRQLEAIEKAYAGIYDPVLNDVFERLKTKEEEQKREQDRADEIFSTNESIRRWKATTGSKDDTDDDKENPFTKTQLSRGASAARMGNLSDFKDLDYAFKNFFINPPKDFDPVSGRTYPMNVSFDDLIRQVNEGETSVKDATEEIMSSNIPQVVKHYYIDQLPLEQEEKENNFAKIWEGAGSVADYIFN